MAEASTSMSASSLTGVPARGLVNSMDSPPGLALHPGFAIQVVAGEYHARFAGLLVEKLPFAVGADIAVQDIHVRIRDCGV